MSDQPEQIEAVCVLCGEVYLRPKDLLPNVWRISWEIPFCLKCRLESIKSVPYLHTDAC